MEPRKQAICDALRAWINQRPGFDSNNYDRAGYRADSRMVQCQLHDARELLRAVELSSITADALIATFPSAFSGRLTLVQRELVPGQRFGPYALDYCAGQYWCTEFRAAACAVLASALWAYTREECMPKPLTTGEHETYLWHPAGQKSHDAKSPGEWLRAYFKQQFGRGIASRWFS